MVRLRFIPAPAGNTTKRAANAATNPVHPRTRGEHIIGWTVISVLTGSSPHPRGTHHFYRPCLRRLRFIPAPAGNTRRALWRRRKLPVHPRTRGEHSGRLHHTSFPYGSSPHPRGTQKIRRGESVCGRFIPAPAGNTPAQATPRRPLPVHPRTRGEHSSTSAHLPLSSGSSPHPRGTLDGKRSTDMIIRFIPAPAGNTVEVGGGLAGVTVHPRTRGEHNMCEYSQAAYAGSSPHPRGTPGRACSAPL